MLLVISYFVYIRIFTACCIKENNTNILSNDWKIYKNDKFEFSYPSNFTIEDNTKSSYLSLDIKNSNLTYIYLTISENKKTLNDIEVELIKYYKDSKDIKISKTLISGIETIKISTLEAYDLRLVHGGYEYILSIPDFKNDARFDQSVVPKIISSFKLNNYNGFIARYRCEIGYTYTLVEHVVKVGKLI